MDATSRAERVAAFLSLGAGLVHGGLGPEHFAEWWGYGAFFAAAATAQILFGLALLTHATGTLEEERPWIRRAVRAAGIAGNALILALYVTTRVVGIPLFGPQAGTVEPVAPLDVVAATAETALIAILAYLLAKR
ncbi:MAG: hypothetical protein QOE90_3653 [Thermoplasmata archaeon]|nr:hypothetical protein [Thermoplasmata archaeon]